MRFVPLALGKPLCGAGMAAAALAVLLAANWLVLAAAALAAVALCALEAGSALRLRPSGMAGLAVAVVAACLAFRLILNGGGSLEWFFTLSLLLWLVAVPLWLAVQTRLPALLQSAFVAFMLASAWFALAELAEHNRPVLIVGLASVWLVDSAAWFVGSRYGSRELAPSVSPAKSWEGVLSSLFALLFSSVAVWALYGGSYPLWTALLVATALCALAIIGDLAESLFKRQAGIKDSGRLLGSHGGMFDRIDSWLPALPFLALLSGFSEGLQP